MSSTQTLQVAIRVLVMPGVDGGVVQALAGLVHFLGKLDGDERYKLIVDTEEQYDWLKPYCGANQEIVYRGVPVPRRRDSALKSIARRALGPTLPMAKKLRSRFRKPAPAPAWPAVPISDGFYERLGCDVIHFPTQSFEVCALPSIYNPHDLQHLHFPQFFEPHELVRREAVYREACHFADTVVVGSQWIKRDVLKHYRLDPGKVQIIPWAAPNLAYAKISDAAVRSVREKYRLEQPFCIYPAVTWPHKNHVRLLEAIAKLRDEKGLMVRLVCTGSRFESHWPVVERRVAELRLQSQVKFLGFVPESDLRALYRLSQFLVLPTLFEADSCPVHEAWVEGVAVASSDATAMPDQINDAGLLFDPYDVSSIADALEQMSTNASLRDELCRRGSLRVMDFDWARTAEAYRAVYRRAAKRTLSDDDRSLLEWDWMRDPRRLESNRCLVHQEVRS